MTEINFTIDDFLGGAVRLKQLNDGYRATSDAVLLSASVSPVKNQKVLDVGMGTGAVSLCLSARCPECQITGLEIQPEMAEIAIENVTSNQKNIQVVLGDITKPTGLEHGAYDYVLTNPPFMTEDQVSPNKTRDIAHRESSVSLADWVKGCLKYVANRGYFAMINRADRLPEILSLLYPKTAGIRIVPIFTKEGEPAKRVIVIARKGSKSPAILEPGIILNDKAGHRTEVAEQIMRYGKGLFDK
ncbi:MAG: methyltransferase [Alphaproteobacteria bacterium]|nr:methyltransferase [Alphaproteobacteria bacterium]